MASYKNLWSNMKNISHLDIKPNRQQKREGWREKTDRLIDIMGSINLQTQTGAKPERLHSQV